MEEATDQPRDHAYVYALTDEAAYLQTDEDDKLATVAEPPDVASLVCSFCGKSGQQELFGGRPVRDAKTFAVIAQVLICSECVARLAETLAQKTPKPPPALAEVDVYELGRRAAQELHHQRP
ncbi:MAG TPA: hypothetical protein VGC06_01300 [Actinomycetes bacterium]